MASKLDIYKGAARLLGHAAGISSLTETSQMRSTFDDIWTPAIGFLLTEGMWNFAIRSVELSADEDTDPAFGWTYAFSRPTDWIRTVSISDIGTFDSGFESFVDENNFWYADATPLYIRYVSNDASYGLNIALWPQTFAKAAEAYIAYEAAMTVAGAASSLRTDMFNLYRNALKKAKIKDAVDDSVKKQPAGRLVRSRFSTRNSRMG